MIGMALHRLTADVWEDRPPPFPAGSKRLKYRAGRLIDEDEARALGLLDQPEPPEVETPAAPDTATGSRPRTAKRPAPKR